MQSTAKPLASFAAVSARIPLLLSSIGGPAPRARRQTTDVPPKKKRGPAGQARLAHCAGGVFSCLRRRAIMSEKRHGGAAFLRGRPAAKLSPGWRRIPSPTQPALMEARMGARPPTRTNISPCEQEPRRGVRSAAVSGLNCRRGAHANSHSCGRLAPLPNAASASLIGAEFAARGALAAPCSLALLGRSGSQLRSHQAPPDGAVLLVLQRRDQLEQQLQLCALGAGQEPRGEAQGAHCQSAAAGTRECGRRAVNGLAWGPPDAQPGCGRPLPRIRVLRWGLLGGRGTQGWLAGATNAPRRNASHPTPATASSSAWTAAPPCPRPRAAAGSRPGRPSGTSRRAGASSSSRNAMRKGGRATARQGPRQ